MKFSKKNRGNQKKQFVILRNAAQLDAIGANNFSKRPFNKRHHTRFPFVAISDGVEHKAIAINSENLFCFHGFTSMLTLQYKTDFQVDGVTYKSVDQYYQIRKIKDLLGVESEKFTDGSSNNYGSLARELLKQSSVSRQIIDKWRVTCGVNVIQKALLEKIRQCASLREALVNTGDKMIVHTYAADDFFGTGVPFKYVKDWCKGMEEKKVIAKIPMMYPLSEEDVKSIPTIGKGRNVLGVLYMILREKINTNQLVNLDVPLLKFESSSHQQMPNKNQFVVTATRQQTPVNAMDIDFTADYDPVKPLSSQLTSLNSPATGNNGTTATPAATSSQKLKIRVRRTTPANAAAATKAPIKKTAAK